jgi:hypothetical protein
MLPKLTLQNLAQVKSDGLPQLLDWIPLHHSYQEKLHLYLPSPWFQN